MVNTSLFSLLISSLLILADGSPKIFENSIQYEKNKKYCVDTYDCGDFEDCSDGECVDMFDSTFLGIGIAATVATFLVPILCCCCCCGCGLYWLMRSRRQRRGQVHQQGVHMMQPQGQVYQPGMQMMPGGQQPGMQMMQPGSYPTQPGMGQGQDQGWVNPSVASKI